jgi:threonine synthase
VRKLVRDGTIGGGESVVTVLTGHILKDPGILIDYHKDASRATANPPIEIEANLDAVERVLNSSAARAER